MARRFIIFLFWLLTLGTREVAGTCDPNGKRSSGGMVSNIIKILIFQLTVFLPPSADSTRQTRRDSVRLNYNFIRKNIILTV